MKFLFTICLLLTVTSQLTNASQIYLKIGDARVKKSLLAFPALQYLGTPSGSSYQAIGSELYGTINNDLSVSSFFQIVPQSAYLEDTTKTGLRPKPADANGFDFKSWSAINADFLIRGAFSIVGNEVNFEGYLYQVSKSSLVFAKKYKGPVASIRKIAHTYSNDVLKELTGETGMFLSKIIVAADRDVSPSKEIFMMDWDGANPSRMTSFRSLSISPAWSQDGSKIAYTAYVQRHGVRNADLFLYDLNTGKRSLVSYRMGINSGASFSPDNKHIYLTVSQGSAPDIYKIAYDGTIVSRITNGPSGAMNVEPAISHDGSKIAFSSDRPGRPMIYVMNADGSGVKRLTFAGQFNSSPTWSPDGQKIAFAGQTGENFDVFVMNADGSNMIRLSSAKKPNGRASNNEDPSFSPDGRFVMYTSDRTGSNQIFISTVDGTEERRVTQDKANYFKPKWSNNFE